ncbi:hypothetical protein ACQ4M3_07650 [Leptolyngbya sp. AN03gr2]|uniref:hypothetical protein n=1 Tax=unclassified Leptolyngbya TaxID=2650499 RepID=UPI003D315538
MSLSNANLSTQIEAFKHFLKDAQSRINQSDQGEPLIKTLTQIEEQIQARTTKCSFSHSVIESAIVHLLHALKKIKTELKWASISGSPREFLQKVPLNQSFDRTLDILNSVLSGTPYPSLIWLPMISEQHAYQWAKQLARTEIETAKAIGVYLFHQEAYLLQTQTLVEFHRILHQMKQNHLLLPKSMSLLSATCEAAVTSDAQKKNRTPDFYSQIESLSEALVNLE